MLNKKFTSPQDRARTAAFELEEVRAEWEKSVHDYAQTNEGLRSLMDGYCNTKVEIYSHRDRRWGNNSPKHPRLRVAQGKAGIWEGYAQETPKLLFSLPELGENEQLAQRIADLWSTPTPPNYSFHSHYSTSLSTAKERLAALEISVKDVTQETTVSETGESARIIWKGTFVWNNIDISKPQALIEDFTTQIPETDGNDLTDENLPKLAPAYEQWAVKCLDGITEKSSKKIYAGILTTTSSTTRQETYRDDDGKMESSGGDTYISLYIDGEHVTKIHKDYWQHLQRELNLTVNTIAVFTMRQMNAVLAAYNNYMVHKTGFTGSASFPLGPRGRNAMLHELSKDREAHQESMKDARTRAEAEQTIREIQAKNAEITARQSTQDIKETTQHEAGCVKYDALAIIESPYFCCFDADFQEEMLSAVKGRKMHSYREGIDLNRMDAASIQSWKLKTLSIISQANTKKPEAEALLKRQESGEILINFSIPDPFGDTKHKQAWVILPDGSLRPGDKGDFWNMIQPEELAIAWSRRTAGAENIFTVGKLPVNGLSNLQKEAVQTITKTLAEKWDGSTGMSGRTSSAPVGQGWNLTKIATKPSIEQQPALTQSNDYGVTRRIPEAVASYLQQEQDALPKIQHVPTVDELLQERAMQEKAINDATEKREAKRKAREAELTPEVFKEIKQRLDTMDAFFQICTTLPVDTDEKRKFVKIIAEQNIKFVRNQCLTSTMGKKEMETMIAFTIETFKNVANRQKINQDIPKLWDKISHRVEQWRSISELINEELLKGGDIALLLDETIEGEKMTSSLLAKRVAQRFLEQPWKISATEAIVLETKELFTLL